jgi:hypothetical protein
VSDLTARGKPRGKEQFSASETFGIHPKSKEYNWVQLRPAGRRADPWLVTGPITGESFPICPTSKEEFAEYKTNRVNKLELELRTMRYRGGEATNVLMAWILSVH